MCVIFLQINVASYVNQLQISGITFNIYFINVGLYANLNIKGLLGWILIKELSETFNMVKKVIHKT